MKRQYWMIPAVLLLAAVSVALSMPDDASLLDAARAGLDLSRYLHAHPRAVYVFGACVCTASLALGRRGNLALLCGYLLFIAYMTLLGRSRVTNRLNLELFWSYRLFLTSPGTRREILYNIWLFIPLGTILCRLLKSPWAVALCALLSVAVELTQYALSIGLCELDDIVSNGLGGALGWLLGDLTARLLRRRKEE